jgi:predicted transcriptional regulator
LITQQLIDRGLNLVEGRSSEILEAISVRDAMMTDMECVNEKQTLTELKVSVMRSKYSFLPVINGWGKFLGLLTIDQIQEAVAHPTTNTIIEAKDLLYKSSFKTPLVRGSDSLKAVVGLFDEVPCIPVLSAEDQVMGLLFIYSVRQAYEKEATKQTVFFVRDDSVAIG